jgi:hypothetical protein
MITVEKTSDPGTFQPSWLVASADVGEPVRVPAYNDKSYAMWGNWGVAGSISLEGSWDKNSPPAAGSWMVLNESDNTTAITNTADAIGVILENPIWIRPNCTVVATSVRVTINCTLSAGA